MARIVLIDSGPLGLACSSPRLPRVAQCLAWMTQLKDSGVSLLLPDICVYEVRRELLRLRATAKLRNLNLLRSQFGNLPVESRALEIAAEFWALVRRLGRPTAGPDELDADAILAGMAATVGGPGDSVTIATTNVAHLNRFPGIVAEDWTTIA